MNDLDHSSIADLSVESATTRGLTPEQKVRLTVLLDEYLVALESGAAPSIESLAGDDVALIEPLTAYVTGLDDLHEIAVGFVPQGGEALDTASSAPARVLGDFRLLEEIGRGGMGVVYRAQQISLDRVVAIKLLPFASVLDSRQIARFKNEAHAAAGLHHPNIVPVHTVGSARGVHYYAMQFIEGESMDAVIAAERDQAKAPDVRATVRLGIQVAQALHAAHREGVIHRDIKPSNLMLDDQGKIWVTDFGLARCQTDATLTRSGDLVGTMRYMSPEQARGDAAIIDGRTDVYSLGATLYEMLGLAPAFEGEAGVSMLREIEEREPPRLGEVRADIPRDLETVITKAMSKSRDHRYETALAFAADLQRVLNHEPTIARPPTMVDRLANWTYRHRRIATAGILLGTLALMGFAVSTALIAAEKRKTDQTLRERDASERLARGAVDRLGAQMAELLSDVPEAGAVRRQLLNETLAYYEAFADQAQDDPTLMQDLAITYGKIGSLKSDLGAPGEGVDALEKSAGLLEQLHQTDPGDQRIGRQWATSLNNLGLAQQRIGKLEQADQHYRRAIELQEAILKTHPDDLAATSGLSLSHNNRGLLQGRTGDRQAAEQSYQQSIEILERIPTADRNDDQTQQLADTYHNLSGLFARDSPDKAVRWARTALKHQTERLARDRSNPVAASRVASTLNSLASALQSAGRSDAAIDSYRQAVDIQQQLIDRWPKQPTHARDLAVTLNNLGLALAKQSRLDEAAEVFENALGYQQPLTQSFGQDANLRSTLGGIHNNLAFVYQRMGAPDRAVAAYRQAIEQQAIAHDQAPQESTYREYLSKHFFNLARLLREQGQPSDAIRITLQRRDLWLGDGERLAQVAEELLDSANALEPGPDGRSNEISRQRCVEMAVETLQRAMETGFDPPNELMDRPEFQNVEKKTKT